LTKELEDEDQILGKVRNSSLGPFMYRKFLRPKNFFEVMSSRINQP
jgi:hypothetical protein